MAPVNRTAAARAVALVLTLSLAACNGDAPGSVSNQSAPKEPVAKERPAKSALDLKRQIHNSFLALSAFECAAVASEEQEGDRLFKLGLNAGREFIAFMENAPEDQIKAAGE